MDYLGFITRILVIPTYRERRQQLFDFIDGHIRAGHAQYIRNPSLCVRSFEIYI